MSSESKHVVQSPKIPKKIFFFWEGNALPDAYQHNISYLKAVNPDYDVQIVDSKAGLDVIKKVSRNLYDIFDDITIPAVKSDIVRMALLYKYGGWYCDCDSTPRISPNFWSASGHDLILFSVIEHKKHNIQNSIIGGVKGHPFFKHAIEIMARVICEKRAHYSVYRSTGPAICMQAASQFAHSNDISIQPMNYELVDVISGGTKGSWVHQERCGLWSNDKHPPIFKGNTDISRFESLDAFEFFKTLFDKYPQSRAENYRKLLRRAGKHYVHKHGVSEEITALSEEFISHQNITYFEELLRIVQQKDDAASAARIQAIIANG